MIDTDNFNIFTDLMFKIIFAAVFPGLKKNVDLVRKYAFEVLISEETI